MPPAAPPPPPNYLPVILGTTIPGALLLVAGIIVGVMCCRRRMRDGPKMDRSTVFTLRPDEPSEWRTVDFTAMEHIQASQWKLRRCVPQCVPVGSTPAGAYVGIYWQYGSTHPIPAQQLACVASSGTSGTAEGHGVDDVGQFNVRGAYNHIKLALTKQYVPGTGNPQENLGHAVQLRLTCCELAAALPSRAVELQQWGAPPGTVGFFGTWHVRTDN